MCVCGSPPHHVPITPLFKKLGQSTHKNYCLQFEKERKKEAEKRRQEQQVEDSNLGKKNKLEKETKWRAGKFFSASLKVVSATFLLVCFNV